MDEHISLAVIYRGMGDEALAQGKPELHCPWVVGTVTPQSLYLNEWYWGHYFETKEQALAYFNANGKGEHT
jgi:hypothetical protein